jgi:imidazoleglycerol phosphate synthase glutamine amidotransferase subunit HisH
MDVALKKFGFKNQMIWHNDNSIPKSDLIVLPGAGRKRCKDPVKKESFTTHQG